MHCRGALELPASGFRSPGRMDDVRIQFEALLFASALKPLAESLGFYGEVLTGELGAGIARSLSKAAS